jgi:ferredoxin-fold anticodon binding domain-containing protein
MKRDFSVLLPENADEATVKRVIEASDDRIISCSIIDTYKGEQIPEGKKSITIRVETIDFKQEDFEGIKKLLLGIGGILR